MHGAWLEPGTRLDFRYERIDQDQPMSGSRKVGVGEIPRHHDEVFTHNRNYVTTLDHTINGDWGVSLVLPYVYREHFHIHNHMGAQEEERWNFNDLGDARVMARRRLASFDSTAPSLGTLGLTFGLKLPTGQVNVVNDDGERAERSLQPGSGTTDLLLGLFYSSLRPTKSLSSFIQAQAQLPLNAHEDYRPGNRLSLDTGVRYALGESWGALLQANLLWRGRDRGLQAEPEDTGGTSLFLSPGVSLGVGKSLQAYGFFQVPLYQYVNGVQLTARKAFTIGANLRF